MSPWNLNWAPNFYFPWSGNIAQDIDPNTNWFFGAIAEDAGDGRIERKACDIASYGRQLGWLTEILLELVGKQDSLSADVAASVERLKGVRAQIERLKKDDALSISREIEARVARLQQKHPEELVRLGRRLRPLLDRPATS